MSRFKGTTKIKAETLVFAEAIVAKSFEDEILVFTVDDFVRDKQKVAATIKKEFKGSKAVIRNTDKDDVGSVFSNTGHYKSVFDVQTDNQDEVIQAIKQVIDYSVDGFFTNDKLDDVKNKRIVVSGWRDDVDIIGSVYTRDAIYNRPYYVINYYENADDKKQDTIFSNIRWIAKNVSREFVDERFYKIVKSIKEIEMIYDEYDALEIEFYLDKAGDITITQVRHITEFDDRPRVLTDHEFFDTKSFAKCTYLDEYHVLSDMASFALTENLGTNPRPLDYSLYRELITNRVWSEGIASLGYYKVDKDIMIRIGNKPYISINASLDGLTPAALNDKLRYKLNEFFIEKLTMNKGLHSRIDTEIALCTCDFIFDERLNELRNHGFTEQELSEIRQTTFEVTKNTIENYDEIVALDKRHMDELTRVRRDIRAHGPLAETNAMKLYGYIGILLSAIKEHGSPQFIKQTRCSLISYCFLLSLVKKGTFTWEEVSEFINSIETTATKFERDFDYYCQGDITRKEFDLLYGHLRLGAFDIRTETYRKVYLDLEGKRLPKVFICPKMKDVYLDEDKLKNELTLAGYNIEPKRFMEFLKNTIINREEFRFECIKSFSLILEIITKLGDSLGIAREDMSYLEINDLLSYHSREAYIQDITDRRDMYHANSYLMLPEVIASVGDIDVINQQEADATFITDKIVEAEVVDIKDSELSNISGKIVALATVKSGYNWIFTRDIAGFIAKYGNADSYMAKRCKELGIPAMIGCGEKIYGKVVKMDRIRMDCAGKKITEL